MSWHNDDEERKKWIHFVQSLNPDIDPIAVGLLDELRFVSRTIYQASEQSLDGAGLSIAPFKVLMHLFFSEQIDGRVELNPSEISNRQGVSRNTTSSLIRNLEAEGLVERRLDPLDRRRFEISLTENGRSLVTDYARQHLAMIENCFTILTPDEQETLSHLLHKLGTHVMDVSR